MPGCHTFVSGRDDDCRYGRTAAVWIAAGRLGGISSPRFASQTRTAYANSFMHAWLTPSVRPLRAAPIAAANGRSCGGSVFWLAAAAQVLRYAAVRASDHPFWRVILSRSISWSLLSPSSFNSVSAVGGNLHRFSLTALTNRPRPAIGVVAAGSQRRGRRPTHRHQRNLVRMGRPWTSVPVAARGAVACGSHDVPARH